MKKFLSFFLIAVASIGLIVVFGYKYFYQPAPKLPQYPTEQFKNAIKAVEKVGYSAGIITEHSENYKWIPSLPKESSQANKIVVDNVSVWSVTLKSKTPIAENINPDVAITEIQFADEKELQQSKYKIEAYSKALLKEKCINSFWQYKNRIYLTQTRSVLFVNNFKEVNECFRKEIEKKK